MSRSERRFAGAVAVAGSLAILPVTLPPSFQAGVPELSGIAWAPSLSRFLVVSDDVVAPGERGHHLPWLFAMTASGALDPAPVPIAGLDKLNDAESICRAADGTFYLTTSHSPNSHGEVPPARRMLLHLALEGRELNVLGRVDLTANRDEPSSAFARVTQASGTDSVDIEAVASRGDSLYLGLKAPLASDGSATILRLANPASATGAGGIPRGQLAIWTTLRLCLPVADSTVCQGISDMAFLPRGVMLLLANSPKGMPSDGGGALWAVEPGAPPRLLQHFAGLKPEGLSLSPTSATVTIVFDRDRQQPLWTTWPVTP